MAPTHHPRHRPWPQGSQHAQGCKLALGVCPKKCDEQTVHINDESKQAAIKTGMMLFLRLS